MKADPVGVRVVAPRHASYWRQLCLPRYTGGPFDDRTGGSITFDAHVFVETERAIREDPFVVVGLVEEHWLKRWTSESNGPT